MRFLRIPFTFVLLPLFAGCGYVHFGRLPETTIVTATGSMDTVEALTNLATENKILKQELALVRRDSDALRSAVERGATAASPEVATRLAETARELDTLRASYARLQAERGAPAAGNPARLSELEDKLAASLRSYTELQSENTRLRDDLTRARSENSTLADQLKTSVAQTDQAQSALAQLNTELLAQKEARARAEQATAAARAQLSAVVASGGLTAAREASAPTASALQLARTPPADSTAVAELRTNPDRLRTAGEPPAPASAAATPAPISAAKPKVIHVVEEGDTLEKIARKYYGDPRNWTKIYSTNNALLRDGRPLRKGMELEIPDK